MIYAAEMPPAMSPPTIGTVTVNGATSSIQISWTSPALNGGSAITGFYVSINEGYSTAVPTPGTLLASSATSHTFSNLLEGVTY